MFGERNKARAVSYIGVAGANSHWPNPKKCFVSSPVLHTFSDDSQNNNLADPHDRAYVSGLAVPLAQSSPSLYLARRDSDVQDLPVTRIPTATNIT